MPLVWFRYIDDNLATWTYDEGKFKYLLFYINFIHSSFQFTSNYSRECAQSKDVSVSVDNSGSITADLYVKPTDTHQDLLATSCHPNHTKRSMPYIQALRILRICSTIQCNTINLIEHQNRAITARTMLQIPQV